MHKNSILRTARVVLAPALVAGGFLASPGYASVGSPAVSAVTEEAAATPAASAAPAAIAESAFDAAAWDAVAIGAIQRDVFALALASAASAVERGDADPGTLTVIDFSRPSTSKRLWVYDLRSRALLFEEHVAHGRNSGHDVPTMFSNVPESNKSSLGLFRAAEGYIGKHGYSLRLDGLEPGVNDRARERAIVIHGAEYVNEETALAQGRLGRSLGCPAVRPAIARRLIDAVREGGLIFAYYPDPAWLNQSKYLN